MFTNWEQLQNWVVRAIQSCSFYLWDTGLNAAQCNRMKGCILDWMRTERNYVRELILHVLTVQVFPHLEWSDTKLPTAVNRNSSGRLRWKYFYYKDQNSVWTVADISISHEQCFLSLVLSNHDLQQHFDFLNIELSP